MRSKGSTSGLSVTVLPAIASFIPVAATMLPALTKSTGILSAPTIRLTCCTRLTLGAPATYTSCPLSILPLYTRPTATSPACGSIMILVIITASGPFSSVSTILRPSSLLMSPRHMCGILYF